MMRAMFWITAIATAISLGISAAPVAWRLAGYNGTPPGTFTAEAAPAAERVNLDPVLAFAPFGRAAPIVQAERPIAITETGLTLLGIALAEPASQSRAIIAGGDVPISSYGAGSPVSATVTLAEVQPDHVILQVNGQPEALYFTTADAAVVTNDLENLIVSDEEAAPDNDPDAVIARYRAQVLQNPQTVMDRLGLEATDQGYRITDAAIPGVRQAGFRPGDVVTTVNGRPVGNVADDQIYFDEVAASDRATVEVQRDGQTIVMTFPLR
jgi:general secretion pathway protein C